MPSQQPDDLRLDMTPSLSLQVSELNLENKELYRVREDSTWEQEPANQPVPPCGVGSRHSHLPSPGQPGLHLCGGSFPLPAESLQDWALWAKILCPGKRQEVRPAFCFVVSGLCLCAATASLLWSVDIGIYVQFCVLFYFTLKHYQKPRESVMFSQAVDTWLWFQLLTESQQWGCLTPLTGIGLLWVSFLFLILRHCILCQLLIHHFEGRTCCIAVCKLFYYFFIIIIKGLTFSSHHCEITDLFEWNVTLKRLVCCFLCRFSIGVGLGIGNRKWRGCWGPVNVSVNVLCSRSLPRMKAASLVSFPGISIFVSLHSNWSFVWIWL